MNKVILVVDDYAKNLKLAGDLVQAWGYGVLTAVNGKEAVDLARKEKPDLILMDLRLPVMDGFTATQQIRASDEASKIPIIMLTSSAMKGDEERVKKSGCDHYMSKPFDIIELRKIVEGFLRK